MTQVASAVTSPPKLTAIVSTYASARFMRGCLDDLVGQTLFMQGLLEILVIDSGSPENESEIVQEFQGRFPNIRLERTEREPLYVAWNRAIKLARGAYITNANTDDRHRSDAFELLSAHLDANPATAIVYADCLITKSPNETWEQNTAESRLDWPTFSFAELQRRCILGPQPMWRRKLHDQWGWFDTNFKIAGDYEFWLRVGKEERIDRYPATLGLYFQNPHGLEHGSGTTMRETLEIQQRYASIPKVKSDPKQPPVVSVIVPTYNRLEFLGRALGSLVDQTFKDFEVILINDCGDPIESLLKPFTDQLNLTYIRQGQNRDRAAARNTGIRMARGKYIAYLDDDDAYRPEHLEVLVKGIRDAGCCVGYSDAQWVEEVKTTDGYQAVRSTLRKDSTFDRDRMMVGNYIPILSLIHERSCMDEVGMFDESLGTHEDWDFFIRLANRYRFVHIPLVTADVSIRNDGTSTTSGNRTDFKRTLRLIHERYHDLVSDRPDILNAQRQFSNHHAPLQASPAPDAPAPETAIMAALERFKKSTEGTSSLTSGAP